MRGAKRSLFEIVKKPSSSNLDFSLGAWNYVVLPTIGYWCKVKEEDRTCKVDSVMIKIVNVDLGKEAGGKHVDTKVVFNANGEKVVCHLYNTTQRIMVNGQGYENFIQIFLQPYFEEKLSQNIQKIEEYNRGALAAISGKRKAVTRPTRSVRYKAMTRTLCNQCDESFTNKSLLGAHTKSNHKKSMRNGSVNVSNIPKVDDLSLMDLSVESNPIVLELEEECSIISHNCGKCSSVFVTDEDLKAHFDNQHVQLSTLDKNIKSNLQSKDPEVKENVNCTECDFNAKDLTELHIHINSHKQNSEPTQVFSCGKCENKFASHIDMNAHIDQQHKPRVVIDVDQIEIESLQSCDRCDFIPDNENDLKNHT